MICVRPRYCLGRGCCVRHVDGTAVCNPAQTLAGFVGYGVRMAMIRIKESDDRAMSQAQPKELDEAVWQAWLKKNKAQEKFRFARRVRVACFAFVFLLGAVLLWTLTR